MTNVACQTCTSCCCCKLEPAVLVRTDIEAISRETGLREADFLGDPSAETPLLRFSGDNGCMFFESGRCTIYRARPLDCRLFPLDVFSSGGRYFLIRYRTGSCALDGVPDEDLVSKAEEEVFPRFWTDPAEFRRFANYENPMGPFARFEYEILKEISPPVRHGRAERAAEDE